MCVARNAPMSEELDRAWLGKDREGRRGDGHARIIHRALGGTGSGAGEMSSVVGPWSTLTASSGMHEKCGGGAWEQRSTRRKKTATPESETKEDPPRRILRPPGEKRIRSGAKRGRSEKDEVGNAVARRRNANGEGTSQGAVEIVAIPDAKGDCRRLSSRVGEKRVFLVRLKIR